MNSSDEAYLRGWKTGKRGEREMSEFEKIYGGRLIPDTEAVQETVEVGLSFERALKATEDRHRRPVRGLPEVCDPAVSVPAGSVLSEDK